MFSSSNTKIFVSERKDSPTCCKENFRLILSIIISLNWKVHYLDIQSAYLQGQALKTNVFIKPPSEEDTKNLWWLLITVYGLCDAQRACYLKVKEVLEKESVVNMAIQYFTCTGKIN